MIEDKVRLELAEEDLENVAGGKIWTDYSSSKQAWFTGIDKAYDHKLLVSMEEWSQWKAIAAAQYATEEEIIAAGVREGKINNESYFG